MLTLTHLSRFLPLHPSTATASYRTTAKPITTSDRLVGRVGLSHPLSCPPPTNPTRSRSPAAHPGRNQNHVYLRHSIRVDHHRSTRVEQRHQIRIECRLPIRVGYRPHIKANRLHPSLADRHQQSWSPSFHPSLSRSPHPNRSAPSVDNCHQILVDFHCN